MQNGADWPESTRPARPNKSRLAFGDIPATLSAAIP
jgi:hypothetical protein